MMVIAGAALSAGAQQPVEAVYKANCAMCHGAAGDANTPAGKNFKVPSFSSDAVLKESDADLLAIEKNGKGKMPAFNFPDSMVTGLVAHIRTLPQQAKKGFPQGAAAAAAAASGAGGAPSAAAARAPAAAPAPAPAPAPAAAPAEEEEDDGESENAH